MFKYLLIPLTLPHVLIYKFYVKKDYIIADLQRFSLEYWGEIGAGNDIFLLIRVLISCKEFRNVFYKRVSPLSSKFHISFLLELFLPSYKFLSIGVSADSIGKGLFIQHGNSTIIHAKQIGDNCWINQNVTIGNNGRGIPIIGNNVRIGTGAVVLGPITIGDNVIIGANATIVKSVSNNCTVVPSPAYVIKRDENRVYEKL